MEQNFGERLKDYRRARNMTQQELADAIGVSNKTVSRWESEGGYPDVSMLVPLAKVLGVTVDDLLNGEKPVRTLTKEDWQSLLSFGFALGGGALFYLLDLFMPTLVCYLAYLGCMAYGVYLQKYYTYHSKWFLLSNLVMNGAVNLTLAFWAGGTLVPGLALQLQNVGALFALQATATATYAGQMLTQILLLFLPLVVTALVLTAVTQWLVCKKGGFFAGERLQVRLGKPLGRKLWGALIPLLALGYFGLFSTKMPLVALYRHQRLIFFALLVVLAVIFTLICLKKGDRRWIAPGWVLSLLCWGMTGLLDFQYWSSRVDKCVRKPEGIGLEPEIYWPVGRTTTGVVVFALVLAAVWVLACCVRARRVRADGDGSAGAGG